MTSKPVIGWKPRSTDIRTAGTRIRCLNVIEELSKRGYNTELLRSDRLETYDIVVFSKSYDKESYKQACQVKQAGGRVIFDLYDNHFYNPNNLPALHKAKSDLHRMMHVADLLVASTSAMAEIMLQELGQQKPVVVIGDSIERGKEDIAATYWTKCLATYHANRLLLKIADSKSRGRTPLIWFGISGGDNAEYGMTDLASMQSLFEKINEEYPLSLTIVSNSASMFKNLFKPWNLPTYYLDWNLITFEKVAKAHAIAVIPVKENLFTRCKSPNRLLQALYLGLAVVADGIPSYLEFQQISRLDDWEGGLRHYLADPSTRARDVAKAQNMIAREWTIEYIAGKWEDLFNRAVN